MQPTKRLSEARKQVRIVFDDLGDDHPLAARLRFVIDEIEVMTEEFTDG